MRKIFTLLFFFSFIFSRILFSQDSTQNSILTFSGYVDAFGAYYTDSAGIGNYQKLSSVSARSESIGLNVAQLSAKYSSDKVRGIITLHFGDIPKAAWSEKFSFIQEATVGIRLSRNLWVDGGFFKSHLGTEGLFPRENITSSISVPTFFEPNYEAGFRLNYLPSDKVTLNIYALNGFNLYEDNNKKKSGGILFNYAFSDKINIGYSNYLGDDTPEGDSISHFRFFNNIFFNFEKNKVKIVTGVDFCVQDNSDITDPKKSASVLGGLFAIRYTAAKKFGVYSRAEVYSDPDGVLSGVFLDQDNVPTGLKLWGVTLGIEYKPTENSYVRLEGRNLKTADSQKIFRWDNENKSSRLEALLNMGLTFP
ncbi:MAG: outer membrane beta-barrel protein [Ignavibacteria bacterium]